jgi:hypothetical protein
VVWCSLRFWLFLRSSGALPWEHWWRRLERCFKYLSHVLYRIDVSGTTRHHECAGGRKITDLESMRAAAEDLHAFGPQYVFLKGGHLPLPSVDGDVDPEKKVVVDILFDGRSILEFRSPYIE